MKYAAILGYGTVGSGVAQILDENARVIRNRAGEDIAVRYILVRRDYPDSPYRDRFVTDFSVIGRSRLARASSPPTRSWWRLMGGSCSVWHGKRASASCSRPAWAGAFLFCTP